MNDPCGMGFNQALGKYIVAFQWNPYSNEWDDISWGIAESQDLITWTVARDPCLKPDRPYDSKGIFTGCMAPAPRDQNVDVSQVVYMYTSVNKLPIHYSLPYDRGCETLSFATSKDGGITWVKSDLNPILNGPPDGVEVTSWRDPFIATWPSISTLLDLPQDQVYGLLSGGIRNKTPTVWLYAVNGKDSCQWRLIGNLVNVGNNFKPCGLSFDFGVNFETTNFLSLQDTDYAQRNFLIMSCEGTMAPHNASVAAKKRPGRFPGWMCGELRKPGPDESSTFKVRMEWLYGGCLDYGALYAASSFWDPQIQAHVTMGWVVEDDISDSIRSKQGWSGCISLPRVLTAFTLHNVVLTPTLKEQCPGNLDITPSAEGTVSVRTLGIRPHPSLKGLRNGSRELSAGVISLSQAPDQGPGSLIPAQSLQWELEGSIRFGASCRRVGIVIGYSKG